jgi:hypothetical protein
MSEKIERITIRNQIIVQCLCHVQSRNTYNNIISEKRMERKYCIQMYQDKDVDKKAE